MSLIFVDGQLGRLIISRWLSQQGQLQVFKFNVAQVQLELQ